MLFNSYSFIFLFLPATLLGFLAVNRLNSRKTSLTWLVVCSMTFYGIWNPVNLYVILPSIAVNYGFALAIRAALNRGESGERLATALTTLGVIANICFLGYFKYKNFFIESVNDVFGTQWNLYAVFLPLGISFITFQKIAFLLDIRSGAIKRFDLFDFLVFVFFFPQLIAGPIVHYREMMPQFEKLDSRLNLENIAIGVCLFSMGLFKKVILADGIAAYASPSFNAAASGEVISFFPAWMAALAYTFQIYFDFSGYSDMAMGLARMFNIRLPYNFNSPLKSSSIIEFWGRWHVTLTRFLTAYVYTPMVMRLTRSRMQKGKSVLGRKRPTASAFAVLVLGPTLFTMLLSGLWHGAGNTFIVWGALHGIYLAVNHAWRQWRPKWDKARYERVMKPIGFLLTFGAVVVAMVLFRASSIDASIQILRGMLGLEGVSMPVAILNRLGATGQWLLGTGMSSDLTSGTQFAFGVVWLAGLFIVATCVPNSLELLRNFAPAMNFEPANPGVDPAKKIEPSQAVAKREPLAVTLNGRWVSVIAGLFLLGVLGLNRVSEFLYWQF